MANTSINSRKPALCYTILISIAVVAVCQVANILPADCLADEKTLDCAYSIPDWIPESVTRMYIRGYNQTSPLPFKKDNATWENVTELDVTIDQGLIDYTILNDPFGGFKNLQYLGLHGRNLYMIGKNSLAGLTSLKKLDLSGCMLLTLNGVIQPALAAASLPNLTTLNLAGVETAGMRFMKWSNEAMVTLNSFPIKYLDVRGTNMLFENDSSSRPTLLVEYLDVSNVTLSGLRYTNFQAPKLKVLNISNNERFIPTASIINIRRAQCFFKIIRRMPLLYIYADRISAGPIIYRNSTMDCSYYSHSVFDHLQVLYLRYNHFEEMDLELKLPNNNFTEIDVSHNDLKFISPKITIDTPSMKILIVSHNKLHHMERRPEFAGLLQHLPALEDFRVTHNSLTFIPYMMFSNNSKLRIIDLSDNRLELINFKVDHLTYLTFLHLKGNRIKILPESFRNSLTLLVNTQNSTGSYKAEISLEGNALECSCETRRFITWMTNNSELSTQRQYRCIIDGSSAVVSTEVLTEANYLCIRKSVLISSVVSSCLVAVFIVTGVVYYIRKIVIARRRDKLQRYLDAFQDGKLRHGNTVVEFIAFLSHSSTDVDVVVRVIHNHLDSTLRQLTGIGRSLVCMGDKDFLPGFGIIEQQIQALEKSCVAIFVISEAFCRSEWCQMELKEAYQQQKPTVLIFTENIDEDQMSPILLRIFKRQVRASLRNRNGEYMLQPSWEVLCNAVLLQASVHH